MDRNDEVESWSHESDQCLSGRPDDRVPFLCVLYGRYSIQKLILSPRCLDTDATKKAPR
jgi:hypothetical protein